MEAFEKWNKNNIINYASIPGPKELNVRNERRRVWRAAFTNMQQWIMGRRCDSEEVLDYINKELGL